MDEEDLSPTQLKNKKHMIAVKQFQDNEKDLIRMLNDDYRDVRD